MQGFAREHSAAVSAVDRGDEQAVCGEELGAERVAGRRW
ncbi:hypothetical protein trd_A0830 (plasmid) [Thermomicrobium roseum DSM 5159]|uniref:Uncharacterized protein n=1 Tax=Thermomicrobium roseum (strain ATCC 27502 / DSM 5159 / P-2) TaxID=309801 RepID=B9L4W6_THERP|nr:hypothetical protein trd_A0830 [Thermomicrobium roseum DSM 5159]